MSNNLFWKVTPQKFVALVLTVGFLYTYAGIFLRLPILEGEEKVGQRSEQTLKTLRTAAGAAAGSSVSPSQEGETQHQGNLYVSKTVKRCDSMTTNGTWMTQQYEGSPAQQLEYILTPDDQHHEDDKCQYKYFYGSRLADCLRPNLRIEIWGDSTSRQLTANLMCYVHGAVPGVSDRLPDTRKHLIKNMPKHIQVSAPGICFGDGSEPLVEYCMKRYTSPKDSSAFHNSTFMNHCRFDHLKFQWTHQVVGQQNKNNSSSFTLGFQWVGESRALIRRFEYVKNQPDYEAPDYLFVNTGLHRVVNDSVTSLATDIRHFFNKTIDSSLFKNTRLIWVESNMHPPLNTHGNIEERRTIGVEIARSYGIPVLRTNNLLRTWKGYSREKDVHWVPLNQHRVQLLLNILVEDSCF